MAPSMENLLLLPQPAMKTLSSVVDPIGEKEEQAAID